MILKELMEIALILEEKEGKTMWALKSFGEIKITQAFQDEIEKNTRGIVCSQFEMEGYVENIAVGEYAQIFPLIQMLIFFLDITFTTFKIKECDVLLSLKEVNGAEALLERYLGNPYPKKKKILNYYGGNYYHLKMTPDSANLLRKYLNDI